MGSEQENILDDIKYEADCNNNIIACNASAEEICSNYDEKDCPKPSELINQMSPERNVENQLDEIVDYLTADQVKTEMFSNDYPSNLLPKANNSKVDKMHRQVMKKSPKVPVPGMNITKEVDKTNIAQLYAPNSFIDDRNENLPVTNLSTGGGMCGVCEKVFSRMDNCRNHFFQVHGESFREKDKLCLVCNEAFAFERNLTVHMKKKHNISGRLEILKDSNGLLAKSSCGKGICLVCCKAFTRMDNCKNHLKIHMKQFQEKDTFQMNQPFQATNLNSDFSAVMGNMYENCSKNENIRENSVTSSYDKQPPSFLSDNKVLFPIFSQGDTQNSSEGNVEHQFDDAEDFSTTLAVKNEIILPEN